MCLVRVLSKNCTPGLLCEASVIQNIHFRISPLTKPRQHNRRPSWCHRRSGLGQAQHINRNIDSQNQILTFLPSECGMHKTKHIFSAQNTCYVCYSSIIMTHVTLLLVNKWVWCAAAKSNVDCSNAVRQHCSSMWTLENTFQDLIHVLCKTLIKAIQPVRKTIIQFLVMLASSAFDDSFIVTSRAFDTAFEYSWTSHSRLQRMSQSTN